MSLGKVSGPAGPGRGLAASSLSLHGHTSKCNETRWGKKHMVWLCIVKFQTSANIEIMWLILSLTSY